MRSKLYLSIITVLCCAITHGQRLSLKPGTSFVYAFSAHYTKGKEITSPKSDTYRFEVLRRDDSGYYRVRCTLVDFGANGSDAYNGMDELTGAALLQHPFELVVDTNGYLIRVNGIKEIILPKAREWSLKGPLGQMLTRNAGRSLPWQTREIFPVLPLHPEEWQNGWTSAVSSREYIVNSMEGNMIHIGYSETNSDSDGVYTSVTQLAGNLLYDRSAGRVVSCVQESVHNTENKNEPGGDAHPFHVEQELTVTLVPDTFSQPEGQDALVTALIKMGGWSSALMAGSEYDPQKLNAFFAANDDILGGKRQYALAKLDILQSGRSLSDYEAYKVQLFHTPNAWLEGRYTHLHNKLEAAADGNADSAYAVIPYISTTLFYSEWLQQKFAVTFIEPDTITSTQKMEYEKHVAIGKALLEKLVIDGDTTTRNAALPLRLWVQVKYHPEDTVLLRDNIGIIEGLTPSKAKQGNAQRYALLLYKQLYASGKHELASRLLTHIIPRLESEAGDSSNANRYAAKSMLAYAWQLKYEESKPGNPEIAMDYLAKAAALSPKITPASSFPGSYDMLFLGYKPSYRADFADALIAQGDKKRALKLVSDQLLANPYIEEELKKAYQRHYPGKDFNAYLDKLPRENKPKN